MRNYVIKALKNLQHKFLLKPQYDPHKWIELIYGKNRQFPPDPDTTLLLPPTGIKQVQRTVGTCLYFARVVDNTILPALNEIAASQAKSTEATIEKLTMLLDYLSTYHNTVIRYHASDTIFHVESDAAHLISPKSHSQFTGFFYCSNKYNKQ